MNWKKALARQQRFIQSQFVFGRYNVPYNTQLVPLAVLYVELGGELEPALAREKLARWYWSGIFGEAYGGTVRNPICSGPGSSGGICQRGCTEPNLIAQANFIPERLLDASDPQQRRLQGPIRIADDERGE